MLFKRRSPLTGKINVREISVTEEQILLWKREVHIQVAMPNVSAADREFIMTGFTDQDWSAMFPDPPIGEEPK